MISAIGIGGFLLLPLAATMPEALLFALLGGFGPALLL
jgi:hypothetical protein